jgi:hypothetical protein
MSDAVPIEILQEVFKLCFSPPLVAYDAGKFPWYLGHVCSRWRALFFSMRSTFWNEIIIDDLRHNTADKHIEGIVAFFLDRTCGKPFSFIYSHAFRTYDIRKILAHSEQWEKACIRLEPYELEYLCDIKGRLPLLEELDISICSGKVNGHWRTEAANIFEDAPLLTHVVLCDAPGGPFKFNWSSLTVVSFEQIEETTKNFLPILRETINLVELRIGHDFPEDPDSKEGRLIHLPHLERLSINEVAFLTILETPSLQQLKLNFSDCSRSDIDRVGITGAFLRRWGIKLSALVIERGHATTAKAILSLTPELDKLALLNVSHVAIVFDWMAETGTQELRFNSLNVKWTYSHVRRGLEALHEMIARRNPLDDDRSSSPKEVFIQIPKKSQSVAAILITPLCRDRGIRFGFVNEASILPWGVDAYYG